MGNVYVGAIKTVGFNFAPVGYLSCDGQLLNIEDYDALYALLGTTYGGDGDKTFALPNLNGRIPVGAGTGPGLPGKFAGESGGTENFTLRSDQLPAHSHALNAVSAPGDKRTPGGNVLAAEATAQTAFYSSNVPNVTMNSASIGVSGTNTPEAQSSMPPFLAINFIIAVEGIFPPQN